MRVFKLAFRQRGDARDFLRQTAAVRVAQNDAFRARLFGGLPGGQRVFRLVLVTVKTVFGVVNDRLAVVLQKTDGVADHGEIFIRLGAEDFRDVQQPGFADDGHDRRLGLQDLPHQLVLFHGHALAAGHAERGDAGIFPFSPRGLLEKFQVLGIAAGPAAFDVMHPERVEFLGNAELVGDREIDAFTLTAVAQGGIVDFDLGFHKWPVKKRRALFQNLAGLANPKTGNGIILIGRDESSSRSDNSPSRPYF